MNWIQYCAIDEQTTKLEQQIRTLQEENGTITALRELIRTLQQENESLIGNAMAYRLLQADPQIQIVLAENVVNTRSYRKTHLIWLETAMPIGNHIGNGYSHNED